MPLADALCIRHGNCRNCKAHLQATIHRCCQDNLTQYRYFSWQINMMTYEIESCNKKDLFNFILSKWTNKQTNKESISKNKTAEEILWNRDKKEIFCAHRLYIGTRCTKKIHSTVLIASRMNNVIWKYVIAINVVLLPLTLLSIHLQTVLEHTWWDRLDRQHFCKVLNIHYIKCLDMIE